MNARYVFRVLRRSPAFASISVLSLGVALGLVSTTFAILDAVAHPYVPYRDPDHLYRVSMLGDGASGAVTWYDKYLELRDRTAVHDEMALISFRYFGPLTGPNAIVNTMVTQVTEDFFDVLGVSPVMGRLFQAGVNDATEQRAVVLTEELWRRLFGESTLDGAVVTFGENTYEVIGVAPAGMVSWWHAYTLMPPGVKESGTNSGVRQAWPVMRLDPELGREQVEVALGRAAARLRDRFGTGKGDFKYMLHPLVPDPLKFKRFHVAMAGAAIAVLLIACGNLVNLMLARGITRRRDMALQLAIGASRAAVIRQVLLEVALIGSVGGALGALLSVWGVEALIAHLPPDVAYLGTFAPHLSWRVFAFCLLATVVAMGLSALTPAIAVARVDVAEPLQDNAGTTTGRTRRTHNPLVVAAVAGAVVLLMGAGLLLKAAGRVSGYDFGFDPRGLLSASLWIPESLRGSDSTDAAVRHLLQRLATIDDVKSVAWTSSVIPEGAGVTSDYGARLLNLHFYRTVSPGFLRTFGVPVLSGRDFVDTDAQGGAAIVGEDAATELWPDVDPVGRMIKLAGVETPGEWVPVVGVARAAALYFESDPDLPVEPNVFVMPKNYASRYTSFVVRTAASEPQVTLEVRRVLQGTIPGAGTPLIDPWLRGFEEMVAAREFMASLFALFGGLALALSSVGLYGILSYAVNRRMREFGVRVALGARQSDVLRLVLREGSVMILAGIAIGAVFAMWSAKLLAHWLYNVNPTDAASLVTAELVLVVVSLAACAIPGLRASRSDPVEVLRAI